MLRVPFPLFALTFVIAIAAASHEPVGRCDSDRQPALGIVEMTNGKAEATFYVDDRNHVQGNGVWVYQESNGVWTSQGAGVHVGDVTDHNLQRGGSCRGTPLPRASLPPASGPECSIPSDAETCTDGVAWDPGPDSWIY